MKKETAMAVIFMVFFLLVTTSPCHAYLQSGPSWACANDDEANGVYRTCNYFPLDANNQWVYTTGDYSVSDDTRRCSSGYSGILYESTLYEYSPYVQNESHGLLFAGCHYDEGVFEDLHTGIRVFPPQMQVGKTTRTSFKARAYRTVMDVTLVGSETVTVPAGTFNTLKTEIMINDIGRCSYKTTMWLAKGIGPIRMHRTDANPADCDGCIFVCSRGNDLVKLNTPAELVSYNVDSSQGPDLTGAWTSLSQLCRNSAKGIRCTIDGKLSIQNIGSKNAAASTVKFYLSDDDTFDVGDTFLKQISARNIRAGESLVKTLRYTFPFGEALTGKYVIAIVDADNKSVESDEDNNEIAYGPMQ